MKYWATFGFASKRNVKLDQRIYSRSDAYAYESGGTLWISRKRKNPYEIFTNGDVVGCGIKLENRQIFFTKNGQLLETPEFFVSASSFSVAGDDDQLFPFVTLAKIGAKIEANFGPHFKFNLDNVKPMVIIVKTIDNNTFSLEAEANDTVGQLKVKIKDTGTTTEQLRLNFRGTQLEDDCTLAHYSIQSGSIILLVPCLPAEQSEAQDVQTEICQDIAEVDAKPCPNCWDETAFHNDIEISDCDHLTAEYKGHNLYGWRSIFAKQPLLLNIDSSDTFYFEISIINKKHWASFGLAPKHQSHLGERICNRKGNYVYESDGTFWTSGTLKTRNADYSFGATDVVGIGVHLANRQLIFTKNGQHLDTIDDMYICASENSQLFPFVSLAYSHDKIVANFGPNFAFDLSNMKAKNNELELMGSTRPRNCWDVASCHNDLQIVGDESLVVKLSGKGDWWRSVFARHPIQWNITLSGIFYFEISLTELKRLALVGFAAKHKPLLSLLNRSGTYAYASTGNFLINGHWERGTSKFGRGDVVGCGVNLANRRIIFTKKGQRLDTDFLFGHSSSDQLFPCLSLCDSDDQITANFGPNFEFDLSTL